MASWQRRARLSIAVGAIAFAGVVAFAFRERPAPAAPEAVPRTDPKAQVESASGVSFRVNRDRSLARRIVTDHWTAKNLALADELLSPNCSLRTPDGDGHGRRAVPHRFRQGHGPAFRLGQVCAAAADWGSFLPLSRSGIVSRLWVTEL